MKILIDLLSTDYGLMSLIVIAVIMVVMSWVAFFMFSHAREQ